MARDLKGKRFGRLLVIERSPSKRGDRNAFWRCLCECGNTAVAAAANIGRTTFSCGCLAKETKTALLKTARYTQTHAMSKTPEHSAWIRMKQRCYNPKDRKYPRYGARGITVCKRWRNSFDAFWADMGPRPSAKHSINRIDNDGNYTPNNCSWALPTAQVRNRSNTLTATIGPITLPIQEWCEVMQIKRSKLKELVRSRDGRAPKFANEVDALVFAYRQSLMK